VNVLCPVRAQEGLPLHIIEVGGGTGTLARDMLVSAVSRACCARRGRDMLVSAASHACCPGRERGMLRLLCPSANDHPVFNMRWRSAH